LDDKKICRCFDDVELPAASNEGWSIETTSFDEHGYPLTVVYRDADQQGAVDQKGRMVLTSLYNSRGRQIHEGPDWDVDHQVVYSDYGSAQVRWSLDEIGYWAGETHHDIDGALMSTNRGYAIDAWTLGELHLTIEHRYFDENSEPAFDIASRLHIWRVGIDEYGFQSTDRFFGLNNEPIAAKYGIHSEEYDCNQWGTVDEIRYKGVDGRLLALPGAHARSVHKYDDHGNRMETRRYGTDGALALDESGVALYHRWHDKLGRMVGQTHHGTDEEPILARNLLFAKGEKTFGLHGNIVQIRMFGVDGSLRKEGCASVDSIYDERNRPVLRKCWGSDGEQAVWMEGGVPYSTWPGAAEPSSVGASQIRRTYDFFGRTLVLENLDSQGELIANAQGVARYENEYDRRGNRTSVRYFDADGQPVAGSAGYAEKRTEYDALERPTTHRTYGVGGGPLAPIKELGYDKHGLVVERRFVDLNGQLVGDDVAIIRHQYDQQGRLTETTWYDGGGQPLAGPEGCTKQSVTYAATQEIDEESCER
jgi:YD repeat-containing protein